MLNVNIIHRGTPEERLQMAFTLYDIDGDKKLAKQELTEINKAMLALVGTIMIGAAEDELNPSIRTKRIFRQMDKQRKGYLTYMEFAEGIKNDPVIAKMLLDDKLGFRR
ncbi:neurocalcin-like [Symsagittifera roscoffensis]|uniref:neurocalcin-like n=1 Tax=Symsagittifera roscoffensis TaxID=84072 RepID=UPI00307BFD7D